MSLCACLQVLRRVPTSHSAGLGPSATLVPLLDVPRHRGAFPLPICVRPTSPPSFGETGGEKSRRSTAWFFALLLFRWRRASNVVALCQRRQPASGDELMRRSLLLSREPLSFATLQLRILPITRVLACRGQLVVVRFRCAESTADIYAGHCSAVALQSISVPRSTTAAVGLSPRILVTGLHYAPETLVVLMLSERVVFADRSCARSLRQRPSTPNLTVFIDSLQSRSHWDIGGLINCSPINHSSAAALALPIVASRTADATAKTLRYREPLSSYYFPLIS